MYTASAKKTGFTFIEALIVAAVAVTIFAGLFGTFTYTFELLAHAKAKTTAVTLANQRMESFRSLPYSDVGTIAGIPSGTIPQMSTTTLNQITFTERVLVEYVDDPADGLLTATTTDSNDIPADYKRIKIEIGWTLKGQSGAVILTSNIVPRSIETTDGGGTVRVNVLDADSNPLSGAAVRLKNNTTTTTIDVTKNTDGTGTALFSGAPAASNYEVIVTAAGYSTDQTYQATTSNPNPITAPFAVLEADISTVTFQIGELSDINITTYSAISDQEIKEEFLDGSGIATSSNTVVAGGVLRLEDIAGVYDTAGEALLSVVTPSPLFEWGAVTLDASLPSGTAYTLQFGTVSSSTFTAIPDTDLPGNSSGFTSRLVDISTLSVGTYPSLVVKVALSTTDTASSPAIDELAVYYRESATARTGASLSLNGTKIIGTDVSASPIYKTTLSGVTDGSGELFFGSVEFDSYTITIPASYTVSSACPGLPLSHLAGIDSSLTLVLRPATTESLRTTVVTGAGVPVPGAEVTLSRSGFSETALTNLCGQTFMHSGLALESDYTVEVRKPGYVTQTLDTLTVDGNNDMTVILVAE